ncbi:hypothetical protein LOY67_14865 [Pseudomonas sp. B21-056]|jgi:hypothetical protein|uniref:hypothetical protein n=1 Tax=Pseudomonas sp. B21-056 TaxID=2895495 RepID=UPI00223026E0|nr:hypothetical protein [Pseudomonas sp. B21-056]UZE21331.1 hypothetical protein LOY67_14865 [Pseudomonas sp. B21-056]
MLKVIERQGSASLRQRMEEAGCAFEFIVLAPDAGHSACWRPVPRIEQSRALEEL